MADISSYLEKIKNAVYGEEVRGSIHDSIDAINKQTNETIENIRVLYPGETELNESVNQVKEDINDKLSKPFLEKKGTLQAGYYDHFGFHASSETQSLKVPVSQGEKIYITGSNNGAIPTFLYFNSSNGFISQYEEGYGDRVDVRSIAPSGAAYVAVNANGNSKVLRVQRVDESYDYNKNLIAKPLKEISGEIKNGYFSNSGFNANDGFRSLKVNVAPNEKVFITGSSNGAFGTFYVYRSDNSMVGEYLKPWGDYVDYEFIVPEGASYIGVNALNDSGDKETKSVKKIDENYIFDSDKAKIDAIGIPFLGKKGIVIGDSLTSMGYYIDALKSTLCCKSITKDGFGGSTIVNSGNDTTSISHRVEQRDFSAFDFVLIEGGTNDYGGPTSYGSPIGDIADATDSTFYGALNNIVKNIATSNPNITIVLATPTQRAGDFNRNQGGNDLYAYAEAIKKVGNRHGVPVVDLYAESGLNRYNFSTFTTDTLHWTQHFANKVGKMIGAKFNSVYHAE